MSGRFHWAIASMILTIVVGVTGAAYATDGNHENNYGNWVVDQGRATWAHTTDHKHTLFMYLYWPTAADMQYLRDDGNETLEIDFTLNDSPQPAWSFEYTGDTRGTHWDTNQPYAYRDTLNLEPSGSRSFSVGTAYAEQLAPATWYYWNAGVTHNSDWSRAGISSQHGYREWTCSFLPWRDCIFADHTAWTIWWQNDKPDEFQIPRDTSCRYVYPRVGAPNPCQAW